MSIKVSFDLSPMEKKFGSGNVRTAKTAVANQILMDSERFVPNDGKGYLRASGNASNGSVAWNTVYARAQFFGSNGIVRFKNYTTPGTGTKWCEKASDVYMDRWEEVVKRGLGIR
jgi:putative minor capsid protein|uniref:Minor capsid protein n=1 Tax=Siphoviridae sp. ctpGU1 TaxID=2823601 RepID=A0A8S5LBX3_9CAUD|nr:MAG TPA: Minor capsid protein [Siphoviridae sp. ctpGU1]DAM58785.1 MAG TPA: Minor capsid protein [Caudoviricetes sp.]